MIALKDKVTFTKALIAQPLQGECCDCGTRCPTYDTQPSRDDEYVPLWGMSVYFRYSPRRVSCKQHGIHVEYRFDEHDYFLVCITQFLTTEFYTRWKVMLNEFLDCHATKKTRGSQRRRR